MSFSYFSLLFPPFFSPLFFSSFLLYYPFSLQFVQYDAIGEEEDDTETVQTTSDDVGRNGAAKVR